MSVYLFMRQRVADTLKANGWISVQLLPLARLNGADVLATDPQGPHWAIRVKASTHKTDLRVVETLIFGQTWRQNPGEIHFAVASFEPFTRPADDCARQYGVQRWNLGLLVGRDTPAVWPPPPPAPKPSLWMRVRNTLAVWLRDRIQKHRP